MIADRMIEHLRTVGDVGATAMQVRDALALNHVKSAKRVLRILRDAGVITRFVVGMPRGRTANVRWRLVRL